MLDPRFLETTVAELDRDPRAAIVACALAAFGDVDFDPPAVALPVWMQPAVNQLPYCSLMRREVWEAVGGYDPALRQGFEDWDFWIGALGRGFRAIRIDQPFFLYRHHGESRTTDATVHQDALRAQIRAKHPEAYRWWKRILRFPLAVAFTSYVRIRAQRRRILT